MAGIYIHIPFCRQKCYYCDFYKTVNNSLQSGFLAALLTELRDRKGYLQNEEVESIYFGGGTPSVLSTAEIHTVLDSIAGEFAIKKGAELTLEANPDDLSTSYLQEIRQAGINRLSIGIQSFQDKHLKKMNRRHDARQAVMAIENAANMGFDNISADLIYGLPELEIKEWEHDLNQVFHLPVQHLSAYHLTYHEGTPFYTWLKKGTLKELNEKESVEQFNTLVDLSAENGFEHYEISNLAKDNKYSRHNTSYWMGEKYLGLGPSAHSFDGKSRRWNIAHVEAYVNALNNNTNYSEEEVLSETDRYNEYILTRIRTKWGVSVDDVKNLFGDQTKIYLLQQLKKYQNTNTVQLQNGVITLNRKGLFISDEIMADLMRV